MARVRSRHPQRHGARRHRRRSARGRRRDHRTAASPPSATSPARAREEIDAKGLIVTPGFVDVHTHYDGQATWDDRFSPSSGHGVTTVLMGNCGVGFAPCRPQDRHTLIKADGRRRGHPRDRHGKACRGTGRAFPSISTPWPRAASTSTSPPRCRTRRCASSSWASAASTASRRRRRTWRPWRRWSQEGLEAGALGFSTSRSLFHRTTDGC